ncbi:addiction module protein [Sulfuriroseicoccus oceanibius]|uniref:Addiction module protein n=1 Tax=Sulfuriroseicoccus oceanibius TaxID=2707525 RepID=A0A6B3L654_9BACT|nr:addiction module protein [Sulfuriroseicoccus oceanibius]QQL44721.1 addiction module protein [Sulfuriroseicoccus oceanibius]
MAHLGELRKAAEDLTLEERAELAAFLLGSLGEVHHSVDDDEAGRRANELDEGSVRGLSREEFSRACGH